MKKLLSLTLVLALLALLAIGCGGTNNITPDQPNTPDQPDTPDTPEPRTPQRYITLWGTGGDAGINVTETAFEGVDSSNYVEVSRVQVAGFVSDMSNETEFPLDAEYHYWVNPGTSDTEQNLYVTKWADGTTSYSLVPFGLRDNYEERDSTNPIPTGETESMTQFNTDKEAENYVQQMYWEADLNRSDFEDNPTGDNGEFKLDDEIVPPEEQPASGQYM